MDQHDPNGRRTAVLDIEGMTCASCVARVEKRLRAVDGVDAAVNLATESARVTFPDDLDAHALVAAVRGAGYDARVRRDETAAGAASAPDHHAHGAEGHVHDTEDRPGATSLRTRLIVSALLGLPVVVLGMVPALQFTGWQWVSFVLVTPILFWGGWPFHRATVANARHGAATISSPWRTSHTPARSSTITLSGHSARNSALVYTDEASNGSWLPGSR